MLVRARLARPISRAGRRTSSPRPPRGCSNGYDVIELPCAAAAGRGRPARAYAGDAGLDLTACERFELGPGERALVGTGLAVAIPEGYAGFVQPRSGLAAKHGITIVNTPGLVDSGYRGEVMVALLNTDRRETFVVEPGDADRAARARAGAAASAPVESTSCPRRSAGRAATGRPGTRWVRAPRIRVSAILRWRGRVLLIRPREGGQGALAAARRGRQLGREPRRRAPPRAVRGGRDRQRRGARRGPRRDRRLDLARAERLLEARRPHHLRGRPLRHVPRGRALASTRPSAATGCSTSATWTASRSTRRSSASCAAGSRGTRGLPRRALGAVAGAFSTSGTVPGRVPYGRYEPASPPSRSAIVRDVSRTTAAADLSGERRTASSCGASARRT